MADLVPKSAGEGLVPFMAGESRLEEYVPDAITWVAPLKGQNALVAEVLAVKTGCAWPEANRFTSAGPIRVLSIAPEEVLVVGAMLEVDGAACADQSDGWAVLHLSGSDARDVLARVTPLDIRPNIFQVGHTARTLVGHMTASLSRLDNEHWEILVFRSMTKTAVHDLSRAMTAVAARKTL